MTIITGFQIRIHMICSAFDVDPVIIRNYPETEVTLYLHILKVLM
jgi:hypothetical protein